MSLRADHAPPLSLVERALCEILRAACRVPPHLQTMLAGSVERDGETLDPTLLLLRKITDLTGKQRPMTPALLRQQQAVGARIAGCPRRVDGDVVSRALDVPGPSGPLAARLYSGPRRNDGATTAPPPLLVFLHGGGFVFGDVDTHDGPCRLFCRHAELDVLSVEYRLAPESPFPAAVDDARAAFHWAHAHAAELGVDPARIAIGGDSAGGNLAAVVAQMALTDGGPAPAAQLLLYPATDRLSTWKSVADFADGFFLTRESIDWYYAQYVPEAKRLARDPDPRVNPLHATDLRGLPPALVYTAGFDPLRDEGEAYAEKMSAAGTTVTLRRFGGQMHGFINLVGVSESCHAATVSVAHDLRALLAVSK